MHNDFRNLSSVVMKWLHSSYEWLLAVSSQSDLSSNALKPGFSLENHYTLNLGGNLPCQDLHLLHLAKAYGLTILDELIPLAL